jgi:alpha-beta hydrolase superfamily lysophospholipase
VEDLTLFLRQERVHDGAAAPAAPGPDGILPGMHQPERPQVLLGHSLGGLVSLLTLLWHPETMEGLILTSPAVTLRGIGPHLRLLAQLMRLVAPHRPVRLPSDKGRVCSDPEMVRRYREDPLCHQFATAALAAALKEGRREILPFGAHLDRPILLLEAGRDSLVDPDGSEELWSAIPGNGLERHRLAECMHEIFHDLERAEAERIAAGWLDATFPARVARSADGPGEGSPAPEAPSHRTPAFDPHGLPHSVSEPSSGVESRIGLP